MGGRREEAYEQGIGTQHSPAPSATDRMAALAAESRGDCALFDRWNASRSRQLIGAAEVAQSVTTVTLPTPVNEWQARELARIPDPETRREVWREVMEEHGENVREEARTHFVCGIGRGAAFSHGRKRFYPRKSPCAQPAPQPHAPGCRRRALRWHRRGVHLNMGWFVVTGPLRGMWRVRHGGRNQALGIL